MSPDIQSDAIRIDCRGVKIDCPIIDVESGGQLFQFVLDPKLRKETRFHAGLFCNQEVKTPDALQYPFGQRFCALIESPINGCYSDIEALKQRFSIVLTHQEHLCRQGEPFHPLMFGTNWLGLWTGSDADGFLTKPSAKSRSVSFMGSIQHNNTGAYSLRREVAEFALKQSTIDCFGKGIREVPGKAEALAPYRFSIAMENAASDFYFSEKLIDCLLVETVPIYYGCPGIGELLDPRGLLTFNTLDELKAILCDVNENRYEQMRPFVVDNQRIVIERQWHSNSGLFRRVAGQLPAGIGAFSPVTVRHRAARPSFISRLRRYFP